MTDSPAPARWASLRRGARAAGLCLMLLASALAQADEGIRFSCSSAQLAELEPALDAYFDELAITPAMVVRRVDRARGELLLTLNTPAGDVDTLTLAARPEFAIGEERVALPTLDGSQRGVATVSRKEIVLALMQHGRLTEFSGRGCRLAVLQEHVGLRQNIAAWLEFIEWGWPDGESARWHVRYWDYGTPLPQVSLHEALQDPFLRPALYAFGCYTAAKLVFAHAILDFYSRVWPDAEKHRLIERRLLRDGEPLVDVEPGRLWDFEADYDPADGARPGKLLRIVDGVAAGNFVPGDWAYFRNTDAASNVRTGYEGSNAIYLGRNRFDDFYNDNDGYYTYAQKLDEVYQWRHGVFSRSRDAALIRPLTPQQLQQLSQPPAQGGLLLPLRVVPYLFGAEDLPAM